MSHHATRAETAHPLIRSAVRAALLATVSGASLLVGVKGRAAQLPVPCAASGCAANTTVTTPVTGWVGSGTASLTTNGNQMTVQQGSQSALLNWQSFNISSGATVTFSQPNSSSIAVNRIFQGNPSQIFGALNANGVVYLLNQNGILFGAGSQVNVGGLVASSLNLSDSALTNGILYSATVGKPAFEPFLDTSGNPVTNGAVTVQSGATINSPSGQVLLFAPTVTNQGTITTPDGQTILGAGQRVFLTTAGSDSNVRGLLIEVGNDGTSSGTVTNGSPGQQNLGQIIADRGNVTLAGLAVNQYGLISATTTVRENGSIKLQAQSLSQPTLQNAGSLGSEDTNGTVTLGSGSVTEVALEGRSSDKTVDSNTQPQSTVDASGATIDMLSNARVTATAGAVNFNAAPGTVSSSNPDGSASVGRIWIAPSAVIDVSGAQTSLPVADNTLTVFLTSTELAALPQQESGALKDQYVTVDLRNYGTRSDGSSWIGTPIADLSGDVAAIQKDVFQRNLNAGSISLNASQSVLVGAGATLNVSGGQVDWQSGYVKTSELLSTTGQVVSIASANPQQTYVGTVDSISTGDPRWGPLATLARQGQDARGRWETGYSQGANAGSVHIEAPITLLDGAVNGTSTRGPLQTIPVAAASASAPTYNQIPVGASLVLGDSTLVGTTPSNLNPQNISFVAGTVLDSLTGSNGGAFNPLVDPLPTDLVTHIRPEMLGADGISNLSVAANGSVVLPAGTVLAPGAGGSVALAGGTLQIDGSIDVPSGNISLESDITASVGPGDASLPSLSLGPNARLFATGGWVNELPLFGTTDTPLYIAGGKVSVQSLQSSLAMSSGSLIDVSAGAEYTAGGAVVAGKAGAISIVSAPASGESTAIASTLHAFGVSRGGSLSVSAPFLCVSSASCGVAGEVPITSQTLTEDGFGAVSLKGNQLGLTVGGDAQIDLAQQNLVLSTAAATARSGTPMSAISRVSTLPSYARAPESLSLSTSSAGSGLPYADLTITAGAQLTFDSGASVSLSTDSRIFDNGVIRAPGGTVALTVGTARDPAFDEGIWLGAGSVIDTSGTVVYSPNALGLVTGTVYGGGSISLSAGQGFLYTAPASLLDASGYAANLYVPTYSATSAPYARVDSAGAAGSINLAAAAGLFIGGQLQAFAAPVAGSAGGSLAVTLLGQAATQSAPLPQVAPTLDVTSGGSVPWIAEGAATSETLLGQGVLPSSALTGGGFDQLKLTVRNLQDRVGQGFQDGSDGGGSLLIDAGVQLSPAVSLVLDAPAIAVNGSGTVTLDSSYVALGSDDTSSQLFNAPQVAGLATFDVSAQFIDLIGNFSLDRMVAANLTSATDIRAIGVSVSGNTTIPVGELAIMGDLTLTAQQVYPATLANYTVDVLDIPSRTSTLRIVGESGTPDAVLSAGGALTLQASNIVNAGTLRAPIGSITLSGSNVTLAPGSILSVSAEGLTIPFGETEGGISWAYPLSSDTTVVYGTGTGSVSLPGKQVSIINAQQVNFSKGATIDISGGGDLMAYEYTPGTANTQDVLSASVSPNTYAILPNLKQSFAAYDPLIYQGLGLAPFKSVYLSGGDGLAAGTYVLLPARYALLPGAYLVTAVSGYSNLAPGQQVTQLDGSVIVSGRYTYSATNLGATQTSGFDITKGTYAFQEAPYTVTSANAFFGSPTTAGKSSLELPEDAGSAAIASGSVLNLAGSMLASPASGGRTGSLDLSASDLVVTDGVQSEPSGTVSVDANQLDNLGVASILLGGTRHLDSDGVTSFDVTAADVTVNSGVTLTNPEIVIAAIDQIDVQAGASVQASGSTVSSRTLSLPTGSALLQVSTGTETLKVTAASGPTTDVLSVAAGAMMSAPGSVILAADNGVSLGGTLSAAGASVYLGSSSIVLGASAQSAGTTVLQSSQLAGLAGATLTLNSSQSPIEVVGTVALDLADLTLQSSGLASSGGELDLTARSLTLLGPNDSVATAVVGSGVLNVNAASVDLGGGQFGLGFSQTALVASKDFSLTGGGALATSGDLHLSAGVFQSKGAYDYTVSSTGQLITASPSTAVATAAAGGSYSFEANDIQLGGNFALPAGAIAARALSGSVEVTGGTLDVAGQGETFSGLEESSAGGRITLQADTGSVLIDAGATLDVSAGSGNGAGGTIALIAPTGAVNLGGTIKGAGGATAAGGSLSVDAQSPDFAALVTSAVPAGFTGSFSVRDRGAEGLVVGAGQQIRANQISLTADGGSIDVQGELNASAANGGQISLNAAGDLVVDGQLLATATANANRGGVIKLLSSVPTGGVYINSDATLNVGGQSSASGVLQSTGEVWITASRTAVSSVLGGNPQLVIAGNVEGAASVQVEANQDYQIAAGNLDLSTPLADATNFMQNAAAITSALQGAGSLPIEFVPGVDIQVNGDLTVANAIDLSTWRFGNAPGVLTLQASGNINVNASISDGFPTFGSGSNASSYTLSSTPGPSWSYRIAAGADLASADPLAVQVGSAIPATGGSVTVANGGSATVRGGVLSPTVIRTGTGSIQIAAAQDLVLGGQAAVIYTAGEAGAGTILAGTRGQGLASLAYPVNGGSIDIAVGRDVVGAASNQLFSDWLWSTAQNTTRGVTVPTAWTVNFGTFEQGIGALGGGDLTISAARNITDLGAVVPSIGAPINNQLVEENSGTLTINAGGNILGGKFLDMAGSAYINAGGEIGEGSVQNGATRGLYPILAMGDSQFSLTARSGITLEAVVDPTLLPRSQFQASRNSSLYATYDDDSSISLLSAGGDVAVINEEGTASAIETTSTYVLNGANDLPLRIMPSTVNMIAIGGDVNVEGSMDLWPSAHGNLNLLAGGNVNLSNPSGGTPVYIVVSDADPRLSVPTPGSPNSVGSLQVLDQASDSYAGFYAQQSVHGGTYSADGQADTVPARIVALSGDIKEEVDAAQSLSSVFVPKPIDVFAGGDIVDLGLLIEQYSTQNVSTISAGGSLIYPTSRTSAGALTTNLRAIGVNGPGQLVIDVGGSIDLGASQGISSYGNILDPALPAGGANISVTAGVAPTTSYTGFITDYMATGSLYDSALIGYMQALTGQSSLTKSQALAGFEQLDSLEQQPLLESILEAELRAGGRSAAAAGATHDNYTRAFDALEALFPGSNPDLAAGQIDPYAGDINLYFSRVYTLSGGNIGLFAPGGKIDVGLSTSLSAFGITKDASQLGVVAQGTGDVSGIAYGNIDVNLSRIFSANGGDILLWSTEGNIDAGRGAKSAISAPAPTISINSAGIVTVVFPPALTGSGIQALATSTGVSPGDVDLFAPHGVVNANEAGIVAGNLTIAATAVLGTNNISVSGASVGVPVTVTGIGIGAAAAASSSSATANSAVGGVTSSNAASANNAPLADAALGWLEVFVIGLGEDQCAPTDLGCLKTQH